MTLEKHRQDWDDLGMVDPLWAILSDSTRKNGTWNTSEFFATGTREITAMMEVATRLGRPLQKKSALDFGCGVGRLTRALSIHFQHCCGVDISQPMIEKAKEFNKDSPRCEFLLNTQGDLEIFKDESFDLIYTNLVLQHLPSRKIILGYVNEFIRILKKDGLLIFQLPSALPLANRIQLRRRLYNILRTLGLNEMYLYRTLHLWPMRMNFIPEKTICSHISDRQADLLLTAHDSQESEKLKSRIYYVTK
ncbi:MAG: methyltransferase domain-containing protein [Bacteroidota bacterium]